MSRLPTMAERVVVKPVNNVYTALAGAAVLAALTALLVLLTHPAVKDLKVFPF